MIICDFCSSEKVRWEYPCEDFKIPRLQWENKGQWAACDECKALVESDDWDALAIRGVECGPYKTLLPFLPIPVKEIVVQEALEQIFLMHKGFREHRQGDVIPFG